MSKLAKQEIVNYGPADALIYLPDGTPVLIVYKTAPAIRRGREVESQIEAYMDLARRMGLKGGK